MALLGAWNDETGRRVTMRDHGDRANRRPDWGTPSKVLPGLRADVARLLGFHQDGSVIEGVGQYGGDDDSDSDDDDDE